MKSIFEKYNAIFEQSPLAIEFYNSNGELIVVNEACINIFGIIDKKEIYKFKLFDDPNISEDIKKKLLNNENIKLEIEFDFEKIKNFYKTTHKGVKILDVSITPILNDNILEGYIVQIQDITDRKKSEILLKQIRQNYETFFNTIDEFLFVIDEQGNIIHTNSTVIERLGYSYDEIIGKSVFMIHPPDRKNEAKKTFDDMLNGIIDFCPIPVITKYGFQIPVETKISHGIWNEKPVIFGVSKDISKIRLSEEKFSKLFYINPSPCGLSDLENHKYIEVNDSFYNLFGFNKNEVIGKTAIELGILDSEITKNILKESDKNGSVFNVETELKSKNGDIKNVLISSENIHIQNKKYRFTVVNDITDRKRSENFQLLSNKILNILNDDMNIKNMIEYVIKSIQEETKINAIGIRLKDGDDYPYFVHSGFSYNFILNENSLITKNNTKICRDENDNIILDCACGMILSGKIDNSCSKLFTKNGSLWSNNTSIDLRFLKINGYEDPRINPRDRCIIDGYSSVAIIPIKINKTIVGILQLNNKKINSFTENIIIFFEGICLNIGTALMRKQNENIILKAKEKAEQSDKLKLEFLANMSHDLRTPMNSIIGFSDLLKSNNLTKKERNDYINTIIENGKFLMALIDDIIDISKIDANSLKIEKFDFELNKLLDDIRMSYTKLAKDKNLDIILDIDINKNIIINSDKYRMRQILMNLIGNSIKFTNNGYIKFGYTITNKDYLMLFVQDTGIGIDKNYQEIIFNKFKQLHDNGHKFKGAGLGLSITKSLIELLGFKEIKLQSEIGKGSLFYFNVPYTIKPFNYMQDIKNRIKNKKLNLSGKKILIVEDDIDSITIMKSHLSETNALVFEWSEGDDNVLNVIKNEDIDLILLDIGLPGRDGYEILKEIRNYDERLPVIIESAVAMPDQKNKAFRLGCNDFLSKPFNKEDFLNKIDNLI